MFDESKHPRAEDGRFTDGSGEGKTYRQNTSYSEILANDENSESVEQQIDKKLVKFAKDAIEGKIKPTDCYVVGEISARQRADIERLTGNTLSAKANAIIAQRIVQHINNNHGKNGRSDRSMMKLENYGLMKYVLDKYDTAELAMKRGVPDLSAEYTDAKGKPAKQIKFSKKIDRNYIVVLAVTDTKKGVLKITSMYTTK